MLAVSLAVLCTGAWFGAILFQSAIVAPAMFGQLDATSARSVLRRLFPRFFMLGLGLVGIALAAVIAAPITPGMRSLAAAILATMLLAIGLALGLVPAINAASDAGDARRFRRLHGASVVLTLATWVGATGVIVVLVIDMGNA